MTRWAERTCTCGHPASIHLGPPAGCGALRCGCPIFDAAWAARFWAWFDRPLFLKEKP